MANNEAAVKQPEILNEEEITPPEEEPTEEEISDATKNAGKINPLDPDFFIVLLLIAIPADLLDLLLDTIGLPSIVGKVIGIILDVGTFAIISLWMYWKGKQFTMPEKLQQKISKLNNVVARKVQSQILKKVSNKTLGRVALRAIPALIIEVVPVTGLFTSWTISVIAAIF